MAVEIRKLLITNPFIYFIKAFHSFLKFLLKLLDPNVKLGNLIEISNLATAEGKLLCKLQQFSSF